MANRAIWTRLSSSENTTVSPRDRAFCSRFFQWSSMCARVLVKQIFMWSKSLASCRERSLPLLGDCEDSSKQVIRDSWKMLSTSLTLLRYSVDMERASSMESPVVRAKDVSSV